MDLHRNLKVIFYPKLILLIQKLWEYEQLFKINSMKQKKVERIES